MATVGFHDGYGVPSPYQIHNRGGISRWAGEVMHREAVALRRTNSDRRIPKLLDLPEIDMPYPGPVDPADVVMQKLQELAALRTQGIDQQR